MENEKIKVKLKWLMIIRLIFVSVILAVGVKILKEQEVLPYIVAFFYLAIIFYAVLYKQWKDYSLQSYIQITMDIILGLGIVHYSGGLNSIFVFLPVLPIIAASVVISKRGVYFFTFLSCLSYVLLVWGESCLLTQTREPFYVFYLLYTRVTIFGLVGYLSGYLSRRLSEEEAEISKLRKLNEIVLAQMISGLIIADEKDKIIYINQAGEDILSIERASIIGEKWYKYFLGEQSYDAETMSRYKTKRDFETVLKKGQEKIPVGFNLADIKETNKEGEELLVGKVVVFKDLSEVKQMEFKMRQADKLAAVGSLAAGIAHELRNPLSAISGAVEVLAERKLFKTKEDKELVNVMLEETERLDGIIKEFLHYTKVRPIEISYFDINKVFYEIINLIQKGNILKDNISLLYKNKDRKFFIEADVDQIKQLFFNLVTNALDAMILKGGMLTIEILDSDEDNLVIKIQDTGCGIPPERLEKVFEPFHSSKDKGIGIGLSIVNKITEAHSGEINVESAADRGTTFTVILPKRQDKMRNLKDRIKEA